MNWPVSILVVAGLLAGWLLWTRLPRGDGETDDLLETGFACLLCAVLSTGCLALLLAELGILRPLTLGAAFAVVTGIVWRLPRRTGAIRAPSRRDVAALVLVVALAGVTVAPASEDLLGGRDAGTYANIASWVARHGTLRVRAPVLATVAPEAWPIFSASTLLPGFYVANEATGELTPQFLHLHPIYMALGQWLAGPAGGFLVSPLFGVLAELAVFFFVRRTLGSGAAVVAASVLALNLAQIWGVRNPYSEGPTQLGVFAALWCIAAGHATSGARWGILGGGALGICFLLRLDALLLLVAMLPGLLVAATTGRPRWVTHAFLPLALAFALWGVWHALWFSPQYVADLLPLVRPLWTLTAIMAIASAIALARRERLAPYLDTLHRHGAGLWFAACLALCVAFAFAMWVRPRLQPFPVHPTLGVRTYAEATLGRVGWYFSPAGLILALTGTVVLLRRWLVERRTEWLPFLAPVLAFSLLYFWNHRIHPDHPWMMRRFLPVIVPGIAVAMAAAASFAWGASGRWRWAARVAAIAGVATVVVHEAAMAAPFWTFREKRGVTRQLTEFVRRVPARSVILSSYPGSDHHVTTPLAFYWSLDVLPVIRDIRIDASGDTRRGRFEAQVHRWLTEGREVFHVTADDADAIFLTRDVRWEEAGVLDLRFATIGSRIDGPPRAPVTEVEHYRMLRAVWAPDHPVTCAGAAVHADGRLGNVMQGFHEAESSDRGRFYWAKPLARVMFPTCERNGAAEPLTLRTYAACGRSSSCDVEVTVNGHPAGTLRLSREFSDHDLPIPAAATADPTGPFEIRYSGPTFIPSEHGIPDSRVLSFQLVSVTLRSGGHSSATTRTTQGASRAIVRPPRATATTFTVHGARPSRTGGGIKGSSAVIRSVG